MVRREGLASALLLLVIALSACGHNGASAATSTSSGGMGGAGSSSSGAGGGAPITGSALCTNQPPAAPSQCSDVTQWGITWTFDSTYPCGQFENGDSWVTPKA